jgi:hypothetical protein
MTETIYIIGPMKGIAEYNSPAFHEARGRLEDAGWLVVCPTRQNDVGGFDPTGLTGDEDLDDIEVQTPEVFERCFLDVLRSDAVALLPGWARSEGARAEALVALLAGRRIYSYLRHRPVCLEEFFGLQILTRAEAM